MIRGIGSFGWLFWKERYSQAKTINGELRVSSLSINTSLFKNENKSLLEDYIEMKRRTKSLNGFLIDDVISKLYPWVDH